MHIISRVMRKLHKQRHKDKNTLLFLITLEHFSNQIIHSFCFQLLVISSVCSVYHCCCWPRDEDRICCIKNKNIAREDAVHYHYHYHYSCHWAITTVPF